MSDTGSQSPAVAMRDVRFGYARNEFALQLQELIINRGERVACIGGSGTGKTTLVELMAGILQPERGSLHCLGFDVAKASDQKRRAWRISKVGLVFQELDLLAHLTAMENMLLPYFIHGALSLDDDVKQRAVGLAETMGIRHVMSRRPGRLSQGERQRVAICRALVTEPELILCDEPTGNLDPTATNVTLDLLLDEATRHGRTLLMVTHDHGVLDRFDRVIDMRTLNGLHEQVEART